MSTTPHAWNAPPPLYDSRSTSGLKPYLELPHLLSLTWLAYPILSLLFVAFRLQLSAQSAQASAASAKSNLLAACQAAQKAAASAASMPRYLAVMTNNGISDAVNDTMDAARDALILTLTVMEAIINFIVDMYRSTFLCFLELVVRGALGILIDAVSEINSFLSSTFSSIRSSIQSDVSDVNSVIQSVVNKVNDLKVFGNITAPQISIPALSSLENVTLPDEFQEALTKLNDSLPTLSTLKSEIDDLIDTPFELVKKEINDTFANLTFDRAVLPIPQQNALSFCDDMDTSWVDDLGTDLVKVAHIGIIILIILALLLVGANCLFEWYKWRCLKRHLQNTRDAWTSDPTAYNGGISKFGTPLVDMSDHNLLVLSADSQHPHLMKIANAIARLLRLSPSQYVNLRWFLHYVFHPPALACFLIGFFGLLSVEIQLIAIRPIADKFGDQVSASVSSTVDVIGTSINGSMYNQSAAYADAINARVATVQTSISDGLIGWIDNSTVTLNNTINAFYTDLQNAVNSVFNGTVLESPVDEFIKCFIGSKVEDLEEALTFLHTNLDITLPTVNESVLVLSQDDVNEIARPVAEAAVGSGNGNSQGIVGEIVDAYIDSLKQERIMFSVFMGLWAVVVLMALAIILWHARGKGWLEAYRRRKWEREQRRGVEGLIVPFRDMAHDGGQRETYADPERRGSAMAVGEKVGEPAPNSFLDHDPSDRRPGRFTLRLPSGTRFLTLGKRTFGRESSADDKEKSSATQSHDEDEPELQNSSRWTRWLSVSRGKSSEDAQTGPTDEPVVMSEKPPASERERTRPPLTINVSQASTAESDTTTLAQENSVQPTSAWSVSPGPPPKLPWMTSILPTRRVGLPSNPNPRRKSHHAVIVTPPAYAPAPAPQSVIHIAPVPLHHAFQRPPPTPPAEPFWALQPPPRHPHLQAQTQPQPQSLQPSPHSALDPDASAPATRLTTTHAPHSSQAVDPFMTPFDDEHRASHLPRTPEVATPVITNPFVDDDPFADRRESRPEGGRKLKRATNPFFDMAL
ncbi:hypothetical protein DAEQUDRAFT_740019 [Daedalea quercina L-15889]|uniref:Plasma membrane fusion protein PRM1 n=1 Tax=Daedalea quercina L-15889 TaxID=1314783 RepID=A0A165N044_9APHY|nr:hypothetical protein DAEQUDRAFT_740019 [Daedalea quercina L-15889]